MKITKQEIWISFYFVSGVFFGLYGLFIKEYYYLLVCAILGGIAGYRYYLNLSALSI
jgi:hypothetical protein